MHPLPDSDPQPDATLDTRASRLRSCGYFGCLGLFLLLITSPFWLVFYLVHWRPYLAAHTGLCGTEEEMYGRVSGTGRNSVGTILRAQRVYHFEKQRFASGSLTDFQQRIGVTLTSDHYQFLPYASQDQATIQAMYQHPEKSCYRNYVGVVAFDSANTAYQQIMCSSEQPTQGVIPDPTLKDGRLTCAAGTREEHYQRETVVRKQEPPCK
jgi:Type IV pilin-like G and H, putative